MGNAFLMWQGGSASLPITETTEYELLADIEVTSTTTNVYINGLNIGKGDEVVLVSNINNNYSGLVNFYLFCNDNVVTTNYYSQKIVASATSVTAERVNTPTILYVGTSGRTSLDVTNVKLTNNGYFVSQTKSSQDYNATDNLTMKDYYNTSTFTMSAIASLTISSSASNAIGIGSRFQLYRATGEVTQTWVTT